MPCYIRYLLSAVHTTWFGFKLCGGGWDRGWKWREGNMKTESEEKEGCGQVPWCGLPLSELLSAGRLGCIQFNFIFHYLGIYRHINTRLFRDKMTHLSLLSSPHQGGAKLPCLSGNIFMASLFIDRLSLAHCPGHNKLWYQSCWPGWAPS